MFEYDELAAVKDAIRAMEAQPTTSRWLCAEDRCGRIGADPTICAECGWPGPVAVQLDELYEAENALQAMRQEMARNAAVDALVRQLGGFPAKMNPGRKN